MITSAPAEIIESCYETLKQHALAYPDNEVCGFVYQDRYVPLTNRSNDPVRFDADPAELARVLARFGEPVAIFHTHPNGILEPSDIDLRLWYYRNSMMLIGSIIRNRFMIKSFVYGHQGN